jgi:hypothetical protein
MTTKKTARPGHDVLKLMGCLRNDKFQLSMRERTLLADLLENHLKSDAVLQLSLEIARSAKSKRLGTRVALSALIHYLETRGVSGKLTKPLRALWCGLADMDRGISNDLVDRLPYKDGPQKTIQETFDWAAAAAKVTLLIKAKMPAPAALESIAKEQKLNSKKLREFRKNIQRGHASPRAQKYYNWLLEDLAAPKGANRRRLQRELADVTEADVKILTSFLADFAKRERG